MIDLPYFDLLLEGRSAGDPAARAFARNVHWGYWPNPSKARRDEDDLISAMDRLNAEFIATAEIQNGQSVLDVGCGFGGTLDAINRGHTSMQLVGLNIDPRQLEIARKQVIAGYDNSVQFMEGDACAMPFQGNAFQRVLAVECAFHFPSRLKFLKEASRMLRPGGRLVLSDFIPSGGTRRGFGWIERLMARGYGSTGDGWADGDYGRMCREAGLDLELIRDITANTLPTYPILLRLIGDSPNPKARKMRWPTRLLWWLSAARLVRYRIFVFKKSGV